MAVYNMSFDSPETGSTRDVYVHGTMPAHYNGNLTITLYVKNTSTARAQGTGTFVRTIPLINATINATPYHGTYNMAIVPKLYYTGDAVTATWGLSDATS